MQTVFMFRVRVKLFCNKFSGNSTLPPIPSFFGLDPHLIPMYSCSTRQVFGILGVENLVVGTFRRSFFCSKSKILWLSVSAQRRTPL